MLFSCKSNFFLQILFLIKMAFGEPFFLFKLALDNLGFLFKLALEQ